jgi:hypothetical protein
MTREFVVESDSNASEPAAQPAAWSWLDRTWVRDLAGCLLLVSLVLVFFWRILTPNMSDRRSFPAGDFIVTFYATDRVKAEMLLQGDLPLWNPYANSGHPLLADPQVALYYPPSLATVLLSAREGLSVFALQLEAVFHFCLAALFTFAFARRAIGHRGGALMAAMGFTFGGYLTGYPPLQLAILRTVVWLPLILLGLEVGTAHLSSGHRRAWAAFAGAGLVFGIAVLAGHAQSAMYVLYASLAYLFVRLWRRNGWRQILAAAVLFLAVGIGISAAQWLPSLEYMRLSTRSGLSYAEASGGFELLDALQLVLPTQSPLYPGVLTLLLALAAPFLVRGRMVRFWAGLGLIALLLSFGKNLFLYPVFYLLAPGFALFRSQERAVLVLAFALAMLAGYAFARLAERPAPIWLGRLAGYATMGSAVLVALGYFGWLAAGEQGPTTFYWFLQQGIYLTMFLGGAALLLRWKGRPGRQPVAMAVMLALVVLDLFTVNATRNLDQRLPEAHTVPPPLVEEIQADDGLFRIYDEYRLSDNLGSLFGLEDIGGASPLKVERYRRLLQDVPIEQVWRLLNVKYVTTWRGMLNVPSQIVAVEGEGEGATYLHRLLDSGSWAWVVHQVEIIPGDDQAVERLSDERFAPFDTAILPEPLGAPLSGTVESAGASAVRWEIREPGHLQLEVDTPAAGLLVLGEVYYPGWRAYVDGKPAPMLRADLALRAVPVPAGQHRVEMVYRPWTVPIGSTISALALAGALAASWALVKREQHMSDGSVEVQQTIASDGF